MPTNKHTSKCNQPSGEAQVHLSKQSSSVMMDARLGDHPVAGCQQRAPLSGRLTDTV